MSQLQMEMLRTLSNTNNGSVPVWVSILIFTGFIAWIVWYLDRKLKSSGTITMRKDWAEKADAAEALGIDLSVIGKSRRKEMKKFTGVLDYWFETGTEGLVWVLIEDGKDEHSYDAMKFPEAGDHLKVWGEKGKVIFDGVIEPDFQAGMTMSRVYPEHKQPSALGFWIHWTQRGWKPDKWARLFVKKEGEKRFRAELTKYTP